MLTFERLICASERECGEVFMSFSHVELHPAGLFSGNSPRLPSLLMKSVIESFSASVIFLESDVTLGEHEAYVDDEGQVSGSDADLNYLS